MRDAADLASNTPDACICVTIGSLDDPELAGIEVQYGLESRISYVEFCQDIPGEVTGEGPAEQASFSGMTSKQS
ncbi:MAG: hypothetical protein IPO30_09385 [Hyphomonadaceae bacterium]|nr:hypothetical protein [Hyphomonadaceae bacterium]